MVIQDLIGEIREDVAVQFAARQIEYEAFTETIKRGAGFLFCRRRHYRSACQWHTIVMATSLVRDPQRVA
jgi:hypothetical protein